MELYFLRSKLAFITLLSAIFVGCTTNPLPGNKDNNDQLLLGLAFLNQPNHFNLTITPRIDGGGTFESNRNVRVDGRDVHFRDFRFYMAEIQLVREDGSKVNVSLNDDGTWQTRNIALLDFENGRSTTGSHGGTSTGMNNQVRGSFPGGSGFTSLEFTMGIPEALNHLQINDSRAPLNLTAMYWAWANGYIFVRVEFSFDNGTTWTSFHLGSAGFGTSPAVTACRNDVVNQSFGNCPAKFRPRFRINGLGGRQISDLNLDLNILELLKGYSTSPGNDTCMPVASTKGARSCNPLVENLGLVGRTSNTGALQQVDLDNRIGAVRDDFSQTIFNFR